MNDSIKQRSLEIFKRFKQEGKPLTIPVISKPDAQGVSKFITEEVSTLEELEQVLRKNEPPKSK